MLISSIVFYNADIINRDGILYINIASTYTQKGLTSLQYFHFGWPFFSIVIAHIHQITQLSFETSANVLNIVLFAIFTDTLLRISNKILPNYRQVAVAALFFLCFLTLNYYRSLVVRDPGYWAFCSLALYQFILYIEKPTIQKATLWQLSMIVAILFRVDGVVILLGLPLYLFAIRPPKQALKQSLQLFYLVIFALLVAMLSSIEQSSLPLIFSRFYLYTNPDYVLTKFNFNTELIETQILNQYSAKYSALILSSGLIVMLVYKLFKALTLGYIAIYIYSWWNKTALKSTPYRSLIAYFLILNIIILVGFIFTSYFISRRYTVLALISLLLLMLPRICDTVEKAWLSKHKPILVIVGIILSVSLANSLINSNSKLYIKDVAIWASNNLPVKSAVITNDKIVKYYFENHQPVAKISLKSKIDAYQNYDYLIVVEKDRHKVLKQQLDAMNIKAVFKLKNKHGDNATVYAIHSEG
ncbi:MAG: hypothetical protein HFP81_01315 [Methylococcales symbiont of Hymedesmia sp. n. MRB-2018]|nr:MAG: hypothetical protein HFP81_01315 [Methylococcales symbiont of Hymedesmia sp. n. MRB-2018]